MSAPLVAYIEGLTGVLFFEDKEDLTRVFLLLQI